VTCIGPARLRGWALRFDKLGAKDGSGKCHIVRSADANACVWGVLYRMTDAARAELDRIEGVGGGYTVAWTAVEHVESHATIEAFYYAANPAWVDAALVPYDWYRGLVLAGAIEHDFPPDYVALIRSVACHPDDDTARAARAWRIIDTDRDETAGAERDRAR